MRLGCAADHPALATRDYLGGRRCEREVGSPVVAGRGHEDGFDSCRSDMFMSGEWKKSRLGQALDKRKSEHAA